jgi:hypothetical protein
MTGRPGRSGGTRPGAGRHIGAKRRLREAAPQLLSALSSATAFIAEYRERVMKGELTGRLIEQDYETLQTARAAIAAATEPQKETPASGRTPIACT